MCSALCNESVIQYNPDKRNYEKIGESTEVALRVFAEKVGLYACHGAAGTCTWLLLEFCFLLIHLVAVLELHS